MVADERDVIRVRTNYRQYPPEDVYLYRLHGSTENGRRLFLEYMKKINALKVRREFYNTLTTNCTGNIWLHSRVNPKYPPLSWKILLSGYVPAYLYEVGRLDSGLPFAEVRRRAHTQDPLESGKFNGSCPGSVALEVRVRDDLDLENKLWWGP